MMDLTMSLIYLFTMGICGFLGCMIVDYVDRKSDVMAGFAEPKKRRHVR